MQQDKIQDQAAPIRPSTEKGYLKAVNAAHRYSIKVRTTDVEEPPLVKMTQVVQDLVARQDLTRETKLTARAALMWFIQSGRVAKKQAVRGQIGIYEWLIEIAI